MLRYVWRYFSNQHLPWFLHNHTAAKQTWTEMSLSCHGLLVTFSCVVQVIVIALRIETVIVSNCCWSNSVAVDQVQILDFYQAKQTWVQNSTINYLWHPHDEEINGSPKGLWSKKVRVLRCTEESRCTVLSRYKWKITTRDAVLLTAFTLSVSLLNDWCKSVV